MSPILFFSIIAAYFSLLMLISWLTSRKANFATFFTANRKSPWYLVAFGMIGASLSGVTFISVPGWVANTGFSYFQMVMGYLLGYFVIATVLLPLYYRYNLVSIYAYLEKRFGFWAYKSGSFFFLLSRIIGSSFRLFLVARVLQIGFFNKLGIPFYLTVLTTIVLIWVYTYKAGIKTIVWTDTLQTFFMLSAVVVSVILIANTLDLNTRQVFDKIYEHEYSKMFFWDLKTDLNFFKRFFAGAFIAIVMTGLDQDMMQKNLTCRNLKDAQKNMFWFSIILLPVNLLFLSLGVLLYVYIQETGLIFTNPDSFHLNVAEQVFKNTDELFPLLAVEHFNIFAGIVFLLGIIAAAFSSADSALTALTTTFCIDFLGMKPEEINSTNKKTRRLVHLSVSFIVFLVILLFKLLNDRSVIKAIFDVASYTYGPLLGLYFFGLFTKRKAIDRSIPFISVVSPIVSYLINMNSEKWFYGYKFGFELLIVNGLLTVVGLWIFSKKEKPNDQL